MSLLDVENRLVGRNSDKTLPPGVSSKIIDSVKRGNPEELKRIIPNELEKSPEQGNRVEAIDKAVAGYLMATLGIYLPPNPRGVDRIHIVSPEEYMRLYEAQYGKLADDLVSGGFVLGYNGDLIVPEWTGQLDGVAQSEADWYATIQHEILHDRSTVSLVADLDIKDDYIKLHSVKFARGGIQVEATGAFGDLREGITEWTNQDIAHKLWSEYGALDELDMPTLIAHSDAVDEVKTLTQQLAAISRQPDDVWMKKLQHAEWGNDKTVFREIKDLLGNKRVRQLAYFSLRSADTQSR